MEAKELRIGNLVQSEYKLGGSVVEKSRYKEYLLMVDKNFFYNDLCKRCIGIPLTEEWLLKFGLQRFGESEIFWENEDLLISQNSVENNFCISIGCEYTVGKPFKYVHQLQNLYFALTGKELELKPFVEEK